MCGCSWVKGERVIYLAHKLEAGVFLAERGGDEGLHGFVCLGDEIDSW